MANSRARPVERASNKLATLTQAMSSTKPTAASSTSRKRFNFLHHFLFQWNDTDAAVFVGVRIRGGEVAGHAVHIGARLRQRDAVFDSSDGVNSGMNLAGS